MHWKSLQLNVCKISKILQKSFAKIEFSLASYLSPSCAACLFDNCVKKPAHLHRCCTQLNRSLQLKTTCSAFVAKSLQTRTHCFGSNLPRFKTFAPISTSARTFRTKNLSWKEVRAQTPAIMPFSPHNFAWKRKLDPGSQRNTERSKSVTCCVLVHVRRSLSSESDLETSVSLGGRPSQLN